MRLDKWLKLSRLIKRRTVAQGYCEAGRVTINGRIAKPASEVRVGDRLQIRFSRKEVDADVLVVPPGNISAQAAATLYTIVAERPREAVPLLADEQEGTGNHDADDH